MRKISFYSVFLLGISGSVLFSCSGDQSSEGDEQSETEKACIYSYDNTSSELVWTAYKTNDKTPVSGTFNDITVVSEESEDPVEVLESLQFTIETSSVETENDDRDAKIGKLFFGTIESDQIKGKVRSVKDGKAVISISMHGIELDVTGDYTLNGEEFAFSGSIDVLNWNGMAGIEALNEACKDLHAGKDGVSKLWSEVGLSFKTTLNLDCK